jgi:hypothetical protein
MSIQTGLDLANFRFIDILSVFVWNAGYQGQKEETWACSEDDWRLLLAGRFSC